MPDARHVAGICGLELTQILGQDETPALALAPAFIVWHDRARSIQAA